MQIGKTYSSSVQIRIALQTTSEYDVYQNNFMKSKGHEENSFA